MPLSPITRVLFQKNPLSEVIAQVRFPAVLSIEAKLPADFQDSVRDTFPVFRQQQNEVIPTGAPPDLQRILRSIGNQQTQKQYVFSTEDDVWTLTLSRDFLSLGCKSYERWEEFRSRLQSALDALTRLYRPAFFSRIGLRYLNVILRSKLGISDVPWPSLLREHISAELNAVELTPGEVTTSIHQFVLNLPAIKSQVRVQHGLGELVASRSDQSNEDVYLIDNDFFKETRTEILHALATLDDFNAHSGRLFRWCITPVLEQAMGPRPID